MFLNLVLSDVWAPIEISTNILGMVTEVWLGEERSGDLVSLSPQMR